MRPSVLLFVYFFCTQYFLLQIITREVQIFANICYDDKVKTHVTPAPYSRGLLSTGSG